MLKETINKIEKIIEEASYLPLEKKIELSHLLEELHEELNGLAETHKESANSIVGFAKVSAYESLREEKDEELIDVAQKGLKSSLRQFEVSHPKLIKTLDTLFRALSRLGI